MYHPELVVQDATKEFGLSPTQEERMREILIERGVGKALLMRRRFIHLKHEVKEKLKAATRVGDRQTARLLLPINERMQHIAKGPRRVEWPRHVGKKMPRNGEIKEVGRRL
jgi:hypothetical protein